VRLLTWLLLALLSIPASLWLFGQWGTLSGQRPTDLGVLDGRLKPPSLTRNSVSSQAHLFPDHPQRAYAQIEAFPLQGHPTEQAWARLLNALAATPGVTVVQQTNGYLHAEAQTRWLRFVDDLEFYLPPDGQAIEVRSASRLGREDFGANRQRVEAIRTRYMANLGAQPVVTNPR
jgi:uncharacterized protein (DUF1499 family)